MERDVVMDLDVAVKVVSARQVGEDRAAAFAAPNGHVFVLADGAGGASGGAVAADAVVARVRVASPRSASDCVALLRSVDRDFAELGQTTAIVLVVSGGVVFGASIGDSTAWLVDGACALDLTERQQRKPLLGCGNAEVTPFARYCFGGRLLLSDGLFKYVPHERIRDIAISLPLTDVPDALIAAARLPSGNLQDDISIIVAEQRSSGG